MRRTFGYFIVGSTCIGIGIGCGMRTRDMLGWDYNWDGKYAKYGTNNGKRIITLVRHGSYDRIPFDPKNRYKKLNKLGELQAELTGKRLNELGFKFDKIYCSQFERAKHTANIVVNQLDNNSIHEIIYDADLNEGLPCVVTPYTSYKSLIQYTNSMSVESGPIKRGYKKYIHRRDNMDNNIERILIIGHGNVFRYYLMRAAQLNESGFARFSINNGAISQITCNDNGTVNINAFACSGHLPKEMLTSNTKFNEI